MLINFKTIYLKEVTIARAVELGHNPTLISALANECSKMFTTAANALSTLGTNKIVPFLF
jgi:hypothetical protein